MTGNRILIKLKKLFFTLAPKAWVDTYFTKKWDQSFASQHPGLLTKIQETNPQQLRLLIGINRSGTTWVSKVLSQSKMPMRYFMEGLFSFSPSLDFSIRYDHTSIHYLKELPQDHRLILAYKSFVLPNPNWKALGLDPHLFRNDSAPEIVLSKQVHSLLGTEAVVRAFKCPVILLIRNPVYVIDSLFFRDGVISFSLKNEWDLIQQPDFLNSFYKDRPDNFSTILKSLSGINPSRETIILRKAITIALINVMFKKIATDYPNVALFSYENLCINPTDEFKKIAGWFNIPWDDKITTFLKGTMEKNSTKTRLPIYKNTKEQLHRDLKFLTPDEVSAITELLTRLKLTNNFTL